MLKNKITKKFQQLIVKYTIFMGIPIVLFGVLYITFQEYSRQIILLLAIILLIEITLFLFKIKEFHLSYKDMKVSVTNIDPTIPFPKKIRLKAIRPLTSNLHAYGYKNMQIPKTFIQSRVDHHYHLYPILDQIHEENRYRLIETKAFKYALIEDSNHKRWIASLGCLEETN